MGKYSGEKTKEILFPLGGIGTGCIGLGGNGRLMDWEIFNRPNKGSINGYSHIAVKAVTAEGGVCAKVLNGDLMGGFMGQYSKDKFSGYGFGPYSQTMAGFPHFNECVFTGEFPIAKLDFRDCDNEFPGTVLLTAFNPLIPSDDFNSSIPAAFFELEFTNTTGTTVEYTAAFSVMNPFDVSKNTGIKVNNVSTIKMRHEGVDAANIEYGDITVASDNGGTHIQEYWYRGGWQDGIATFWREFSSSAGLKKRIYTDVGKNDMCTICTAVNIAPGKSKKVRFVLSWNVPNNYNYWNPLKDENGADVTWKNYYATVFADSTASAVYSLENWDALYNKTMEFKNTLFGSTLDESVIDAVSANLSVLKSATVLRLEDGSFYGWEGVHEKEGSCEGTCSHVWNYAYALCFLFPKLERSIRELEFKHNVLANGEMNFRMKLPLGRPYDKFRACVDGQMGTVIKTYREWKISGDDDWLRTHWETVLRILEYAWETTNEDKWDLDKDGVLEGRQHHTLDMELFGPSSWLEGFYLVALKAGAEMAERLGHNDKAREYLSLFQKGREWTKNNLFNGKYFIQKINLRDKSIIEEFDALEYWNEETGEIKYQIAEGCEIDQMCAQWHAAICGLGDIFDAKQRRIALENLYNNNFKPSMRNSINPWRIFSLNDESGAVICDYPEGAYKPVIPIPYCEEAMHGFEYQLAGLLISEGMIGQGVNIVKSVRARYDGEKRNPWNEIECGSNYARSMASFALMPIFSGFIFDLPDKCIGFNPKTENSYFNCIWSLESAWGNFEMDSKKLTVHIKGGALTLQKVRLPFAEGIFGLIIDGKKIKFDFIDKAMTFQEITIRKNLEVCLT